MSPTLFFLLIASLVGLIGVVAYRDFTRPEGARLWPTGLLAVLAAATWWLARPDGLETKGGSDVGVAVVLCYLAMLFGMVAQYGYAQGERGRRRFRFELVSFLMPIFASPIIFIPLLSLTAELSVGGAFTQSKLMVYLVAFQNGFFWKGFFEQQRKRAVEQAA
jgi:ABC-type glycerol-3-phosphate transport system permease component